MAEMLMETVKRLQSRLRDNPESRKLLKTLKRLRDVPMTVDILVETGVGKTVNSYRKHEAVGEAAKSLVTKWKKLVPQTADRANSHVKEPSHSHRGHKRPREPSPEEGGSYAEAEERGYHTIYSPSPPQHKQYSPQQEGRYQSDQYESPEPEPSPPPPPPPRKDLHHIKPNKEPSKNHHHKDGERQRQQQQHTEVRRSNEKSREWHQSPPQKTAKHMKTTTTSAHDRKEEKKKGGDCSEGRRQQKETQPQKVEDDYETPTMSFESFLTYDAPTVVKKKKKSSSQQQQQQLPPSSSHSRPSQSSSSTFSSSRGTRSPQPSSSSSSSKYIKTNGSQSTKRSHPDSSTEALPTPEKRRRVVEEMPMLPEIPLPAIQPNYRPLPSMDVTPLSPQRRKGPVCNDEDDAGFTGKRLNSKMVVYSGSKTAYLPKMMTLYEQCIRVLQNNIDSIAEVGGVPFDILEPVLERCTPEQLYRIEELNQCFTEDSNELWRRHCQHDFKRESRKEYESWRELYLRLHDEREARLRLLTQNITSAHANKPKVRQAKIAFEDSFAKPPRDVRRRQEKFGTTSGSSAASTFAACPIKPKAAAPSVHPAEPSGPSSSQFIPAPSSSRSSGPSAAAVGAVALGKPQPKKKAPMMAKTIKAFKNRFSRR
ncbi:elongin-A [Gouania willdenowi]|uniref:Elongin-A n=1 Tax=Gouania willdenowi TaxID=441366 RepID=A0A8C5DR66_GOUWI|nr:elongin-A [Gouania willdenowi]